MINGDMKRLFDYILNLKQQARMNHTVGPLSTISLSREITIQLSQSLKGNQDFSFNVSVNTCNVELISCHIGLNSASIGNLGNKYCGRAVPGLGQCIMKWMICLVLYFGVPTLHLIDLANVKLQTGTFREFNVYERYKNTPKAFLSVPYRLLKFHKLLNSMPIDEMKNKYEYWYQLSYYHKFGFIDDEALSIINYNDIQQYYSKDMKDIDFFAANMVLDLRDTSNPYTYIHSRMYENDLVSYLKNWKVSIFIKNCFHLNDTTDTISATQTDNDGDETDIDLTPSFGRFYRY